MFHMIEDENCWQKCMMIECCVEVPLFDRQQLTPPHRTLNALMDEFMNLISIKSLCFLKS